MKHRVRLAILAVGVGMAMLAAPLAHAFTYEDLNNTNADGTAKYVDPGDNVSNFGNSGGQNTLRQGNTALQFGQPQTFQQRYNPSNLFDPLGRPAGER
jgi:hypothetical protein